MKVDEANTATGDKHRDACWTTIETDDRLFGLLRLGDYGARGLVAIGVGRNVYRNVFLSSNNLTSAHHTLSSLLPVTVPTIALL